MTCLLCNTQVFEALAAQFVAGRMFGISDAQLALLASAFASVGHTDSPALYRTLARLVSGRLDRMAPGHLATVAWALAAARAHSSLIMRAASAAAVRDPGGLSATQLANLQAALVATGEARGSRELTHATRMA